ncbi:uncharacterized protein AMSG_06679 [Thecamonas trahens ATCC 50062]|uniref:Uncharacterized protein n=1 Tax=Thecamonas trahens ATCC 50062 TaxID=461836 RepID=A0A0L0DEM4_THETB|nr:hypothetical protein AMSG_06679 [Thecamonas trahens ATCC 50062]KNC50782.1 hypothetical protein AMSG_06679 [Thecamonas trahens ATCC 50062]|eukprot:XP_013756741.1 hypothetical protein AMSG_06679 [Thecamonas trahens ATCC 50062]
MSRIETRGKTYGTRSSGAPASRPMAPRQKRKSSSRKSGPSQVAAGQQQGQARRRRKRPVTAGARMMGSCGGGSNKRAIRSAWEAQFADGTHELFASGRRTAHVREQSARFNADVTQSAAEMHIQAYELARGVRSQFVTPKLPKVHAFGYSGSVARARLAPDLHAASLASRKFSVRGDRYGVEGVILERLKRSMGEYNMTPDAYCILDAMVSGKVPDAVLKRHLGPDVTPDDLMTMYTRRYGDDAGHPSDEGKPNTHCSTTELDSAVDRVMRQSDGARRRWRETVSARPATASAIPDRRQRILDRVEATTAAAAARGIRPSTAAATVAAVKAAASVAQADAADSGTVHAEAPAELVDIMDDNALYANAGYKAHLDDGLTKLRFRHDVRPRPPTLTYSGERRRILVDFPYQPTTIENEVASARLAAAGSGSTLVPASVLLPEALPATSPTSPPSAAAKARANPSEFVAVDDLVDMMIRPRSTKFEPVEVHV